MPGKAHAAQRGSAAAAAKPLEPHDRPTQRHEKMLDENRYCGDILIQIAAVERALQSFGYIILKDHMETCVVEGVKNGDLAVVDEAVELMKKLK